MAVETNSSTMRAENQSRSRLVLVDDHAILREGLYALFGMEHDLEIVGEAANGMDAVRVVQQLSPALVITDIALQCLSGSELILTLRDLQQRPKILVLTAHGSENCIRAALTAGADGYVLKDTSRADLLQAVRAVLSGQTYLCSWAAAKVVSGYLNGKAQESTAVSAEHLTSREREVLTRVASGQCNRVIALSLGVSVKTIEKHRSSLMHKLTLRNTAAVTRFAIEHGMVIAADLDKPTD